ncbi:SF1B family DNA helicase RecD2 [Anaerovibrio sp.]|uniref:SF1B family DNA helicase RecD2 n=1 Tax=Anaerovibrio sp. TaxID=1872532 RepID=UPI003F17308A
MAKLRCVVERITYQSPETGYTVLKVRVKDYAELVAVVGNLLDASVGSVLLIEGSWKVDSRYGRQFVAESWEETMPATVYGIEKYLGSGLIKGVGPKFAKRIVRLFGAETITVIEDDIDRLRQVEGIGEKRIRMIKESWQKQKEVKNIMLFLQSNGVSTAYAAKIYKEYGNEAIDKVRENPFRMADDIWGIGFKTADTIAEKLGFGKDSFVRLRSGIMYTLSALADEGHVYAGREQLVNKAVELLETDAAHIQMTLDSMLAEEELILEEDAIFLPAFNYAEKGTAGKLIQLSEPYAGAGGQAENAPSGGRLAGGSVFEALGIECQADIGALEKKLGIRYDEIQALAIQEAMRSKVMVLTGGPGTGKTTTVQGIIAAYGQMGMQILLAAPTGRAAKRMSEATGMPARTIHRLLECKPPDGYQRNEENPLEGDVLIVDECSMIDIILMNSLLKALPRSMRLVLVGDIDQLPSVGAGNVLRDIIDSGRFPVIRLTRIFRQAQQSRIITNAHRINKGEFPDISNGRNTDFFFISNDNPEEAVQEIVALVSKKLPQYYGVRPSEVQVLTPMQRGILGSTSLNQTLQAALNPDGEGLRRGGLVFRLYDKVMQIKNNYDKEVFNGDIGRIAAIDVQGRTLQVTFDGRMIDYDVSELDELVHAYATTIHKAQGSEYPIVVMPMLMTHFVMLQRNLLYTGITRAKKVLVMIGSKKALAYAVRNVTVSKRNTRLKERLMN